MATKTVKVFTVLHGARPDGAGPYIARFRNKADAGRFAATRTCYGEPAKVDEDDVPKAIAQRWDVR